MVHTALSLRIAAPPERVAAMYADYEQWPRLFPATIRGVRRLAVHGPCQKIEVSHTSEGKVINIMITISPLQIQLDEFKRHFDARFLNSFEASDQDTRYSIVADVRLKGAARLLGPFAEPIVRSRLRRYVLEPVREAVERGLPNGATHAR